MSWLSEEKPNRAIDTVNKLAQIAGLLLAGAWAYWTFTQNTLPTLEKRGVANISVDWDVSKTGQCVGILNVGLENKGTKAFELRSFHVIAWIYPANSGISPKASLQKPVRVDFDQIARGKSAIDEVFKEPLLIGHYSTGVSRDISLNWTFQPDRVVSHKPHMDSARSSPYKIFFRVIFDTNDDEHYIPEENRIFDYCPVTKGIEHKN